MNEGRARIIGTGSYLPPEVLHNLDLEKTLDTSDDWIRTRTGIVERRIAAKDQTASDLALEAARPALEEAGITAAELDLILMASITADTACPSGACWLQAKLGANRAVAFDVVAAWRGGRPWSAGDGEEPSSTRGRQSLLFRRLPRKGGRSWPLSCHHSRMRKTPWSPTTRPRPSVSIMGSTTRPTWTT